MKQKTIPLIRLLNVSNPDRYKTVSITSIEFKNRFLNTLSQKKVKDIYTLISFTIEEIFDWDGMGVGTVYHSVRQLYDFFKSICDWRDYLCIIPNFIGKNKNVTRKNYGASGMHGSGIKLSWII